MSTPSIALIPSGYKSGKLYSQLPVNGDGDLTFTRVGDATRVNENGLIEEMATGVPRLDYSDGGCPSLLVEPSSTNIIQYSEDFSQGYWNKQSSTVTSGFLSPKNDTSAYKLIPDNGTGGNRSLSRSFSSLTGLHTFSAFVKDNDFNYVHLRLRNSPNSQVVFDLSNETFTNYSAESGSIIKIGDYYRISATFDPSNSDVVGQLNVSISLSDSGGNISSFDGDGVKGITVWGVQLEELSYATSYIPTNGTTETRDAEGISKSGLSDYINSSEGVLYVEMKANVNGGVGNNGIRLQDGSGSLISIYYSDSQNFLTFAKFVSFASQWFASVDIGNQTNLNKFALRYASSGADLFLNGVKTNLTNLDASFSANTLNEIVFLGSSGSNTNLQGKVKDLRVYKTALTDIELQTLTS